MPTESLFQPLAGAAPAATVRVRFNQREITVPGGTSVAAALLQAGVQRFRATPVSGAPRAPFCMMGVCFECLLEIDGVPSRQACLVQVRDGMVLRTQEGLRGFEEAAAGESVQEEVRRAA